MKDEIRLKHAIMEVDNEIAFCREVIASGVKGDDLEQLQIRLKKAEAMKKKLLAMGK